VSKPIPLKLWGNRVRGDYPPSLKTLYRWANAGKIYPRPTKIGRDWFVSEKAIYIDTSDPDFHEKAARADESSPQQR
jgi:hypothetical protein